ncbi:DUF389 domain-containing protein [Altererythrobacter sp. KTW20L]|uniref:DUF389 domain-containing protein n=1 Tax=Altererythrobacter sp. KTW20L TaxID=2942210 RepID=UPI0020C06D10|nr:DUF389 domain-containing protein [Altererythrobacter sp. KTW20L]MCL6250300.1 DUF389 domain-containing protein [Altererythrobacter sp. KTW20L]
MATQAPAPGRHTFGDVIHSWRGWWHNSVKATVDQADVIARRRAESGVSSRYLLMLGMSAGIAILGLLLSSPAVVIGAMLLSPLMDPIMGLGFSIATGDYKWMRQSARSLAIGTVFAVLFCAIVVFLSPLQTVTSEIAARTKPNLFDLLIAFFSAIAGAYAMIRGREGTIVGVAIATALMPPLATVGFGLATLNWTVFSGALGLYFTNLMTIALTAAVMARLYGFSTNLSERQTTWQTVMILTSFVALAIPLFLSLRDIAWEANATRLTRSMVLEAFDDNARLSQIDYNFDAEPIRITATVLTPELKPNAESAAERAMTRSLGRPVDVAITQYRVGTNAQAAEEAQLSSALASERAAAERADELAERLALVAGVSPEQVTVDRARRRATVTALALPDASLRTYYELERRIRATAGEGWEIRLIPPLLSMPAVAMEDEGISTAGYRTVVLIEWAARRSQLPVRLEGPGGSVALVREALQERGIEPQVSPAGNGFGAVRALWVMPDGAE